MLLKFALKKVNGWSNRHHNKMAVIKLLRIRMRNGFNLTIDERQFYDDTLSLLERYNTNNSFYD